MVSAQFIYKVARVVAFGFKALNFFLDIWQTWQFATGGGSTVVIATLIAYFQNKPVWLITVLAIAAGALAVCLASLIFKSYALKVTEKRNLHRLPRLVYDIHKRISFVRGKLIRKTDWESVDIGKIASPLLDMFGSLEISDNKIEELRNKLLASASEPSGIASVSDAMMKGSDTNLEACLEKDFRYRFYCAYLDGYIPYPSEAIGDMVSKIINTSFSLNNLVILQAYMQPDSLSLEKLSELTTLSDAARMRVYSVNVQAEKRINDAIIKACTKLNVLIDEYLAGRIISK